MSRTRNDKCRFLLTLSLTLLPAFLLSDESHSIPQSIPTGLEQDVSEELNLFIASLPKKAKVSFPEGAVYRVEGTVTFEGFESLSIQGNGATLQSMDSLPDADKKEDYTAWKKLRTRTHLLIRDTKNVRVEKLRIIGAHPNGGREGEYDYNREAQHGLELIGVEGAEIEAVNASDVWGDGLYISGDSERIEVRKCRFETVGRQGIAIGKAWRILIENCEILDSRRGLIDIEPYGEDWATGDIRIIGNRFGGSRLLALPMGGSGSIGAVLVANNRFEGPNGTPLVMNRTKNEGIERGPFFFVGNEGKVGGSPAPGLRIGEVDGVLVSGNRLQFNPKREMTALHYRGNHAGVFGNHFVDAVSLTNQESAPKVSALANDFASGPARPAQVEEIPGGYAIRQELEEGVTVVGLMRRLDAGSEPLEKFGLRTESSWAWAVLKDGKVVERGEGPAVSEEVTPEKP